MTKVLEAALQIYMIRSGNHPRRIARQRWLTNTTKNATCSIQILLFVYGSAPPACECVDSHGSMMIQVNCIFNQSVGCLCVGEESSYLVSSQVLFEKIKLLRSTVIIATILLMIDLSRLCILRRGADSIRISRISRISRHFSFFSSAWSSMRGGANITPAHAYRLHHCQISQYLTLEIYLNLIRFAAILSCISIFH